MTKREEVQKFVENYERELINEASLLKCAKMPEASRELFELFSKTGNRLKYEKVYFTRRKYLLVFFMEIIIEMDKSKSKKRDKAKENDDFINDENRDKIAHLEGLIEEILSEECWALPAHVDLNREGYEKTLDLFSAETAQMLAEIITILPDISESLKKKVIDNVYERVLIPFDNERQGFETNHSNWSAVCAGSIGVAAIYLRKYIKDYIKDGSLYGIIDRVNSAMEYYANGISEDGICFEGLDYWNYGLSYYMLYASVLEGQMGAYVGLLDKPRIRRTMDFQNNCFYTSGKTVSFSDGSSESYYKMGLAAFLAMKNNQEIPDVSKAAGLHTDTCYRFAYGYRDYIWAKEYIRYLEKGVEVKAHHGRTTIYPKGEWAIAESDNGIGFAIKGGNNNEPHNHNDVSNFIYYVGDKEVITDLGAGEYTKDYFGDKRYEILCNSARGHNVPIILGSVQCAGDKYRATFFDGKSVVKEGENGGKPKEICEVCVEFGNTYPVECKAVRKTDFDIKTGELTIEDEFKLILDVNNLDLALKVKENDGVFVKENLITREMPRLISDNEICFGEDIAILHIDNPASKPQIDRHIHINHAGEEEEVYTISWDVNGSKQRFCLLGKK